MKKQSKSISIQTKSKNPESFQHFWFINFSMCFLNVQYILPEDLTGPVSATLYFNANNLTDETDLRYAGNNTVNQSESYGRRFLVGLRLSY